MAQAQHLLPLLRAESSAQAQRLVKTLETFIPRIEQVIQQTVQRVIEEKSVAAQEKLVSLFEPHTDIIRRQKPPKPTEFGHKIWLAEVDGGIVRDYRILEGNPPDHDQWPPTLEHHRQQFGKAPYQASGDRALYSPDNEAYATELGVKRVILPTAGHKSAQPKQQEHQPWFKRGRRFHAAIEGRISVLFRKHDLGHCLDHGKDGFGRWVGWGIIAGNLAVIGQALT